VIGIFLWQGENKQYFFIFLHIFGFKYLKNIFFFKILKKDDDLNYLAKFVEQFFANSHLDATQSAKNTSPKLKI
jgi:hypothetical protein